MDITPNMLAVSVLVNARRYVASRWDGADYLIGKALWALIDELTGEDWAAARVLVSIDIQRTRAELNN